MSRQICALIPGCRWVQAHGRACGVGPRTTTEVQVRALGPVSGSRLCHLADVRTNLAQLGLDGRRSLAARISRPLNGTWC